MADNPGAITKSAYFFYGHFWSRGHSISMIEWFFHQYISTGLLNWVNVRNPASDPEFSDPKEEGSRRVYGNLSGLVFHPLF
jgi:hypothetical protein